MRSIHKKALKMIVKLTEHEIKRDQSNGHPFCLGIFHQPKRPVDEGKEHVPVACEEAAPEGEETTADENTDPNNAYVVTNKTIMQGNIATAAE